MQRDADLHIGAHGVTPNLVAEIDRILRKQELAKLRFTIKDTAARKTLLEEVAAAVGAEIAGSVGRTAAIYRYSDEAPKHLV